MIHPLSDVKTENIGEGTNIWQYSVVLKYAVIGKNCNINCHTFIENDVIIGNNVTIKSGVYLWDGIRVEDNVFIGPNATFVNDKYPRSKQYIEEFSKTTLMHGCSIGANATILANLKIGNYALVGAGSVVTKNIKPHALVVGNPAVQIGWVNKKGEILKKSDSNLYFDSNGVKYSVLNGNLEEYP